MLPKPGRPPPLHRLDPARRASAVAPLLGTALHPRHQVCGDDGGGGGGGRLCGLRLEGGGDAEEGVHSRGGAPPPPGSAADDDDDDDGGLELETNGAGHASMIGGLEEVDCVHGPVGWEACVRLLGCGAHHERRPWMAPAVEVKVNQCVQASKQPAAPETPQRKLLLADVKVSMCGTERSHLFDVFSLHVRDV